jgi:hypothetical protein
MIGLHVCLGELVQNRIVVDDAARSAQLIQCNYHYKFRRQTPSLWSMFKKLNTNFRLLQINNLLEHI